MRIGSREFDVDAHTYVVGILNMTPDSFSDGGAYNQKDRALKRVADMIESGADIIDVGGESTRPDYQMISDEEEMERVIPAIRLIKQNFEVPVSIDTYKSKVARAGIEAGADMINDIWGLKYDKDMAKVIAESGLPCCLMHNREKAEYTDFMKEVMDDLKETLRLAHEAGIADDKIILDPGVGFGKDYDNNLEVINRLSELKMLGYPVLLGASRKSVVGMTLDLPSNQRVEGTIVTTVLAVVKGCAFVRVHDIIENGRAIKMAEAIIRKG